jgi:hypothetical protein
LRSPEQVIRNRTAPTMVIVERMAILLHTPRIAAAICSDLLYELRDIGVNVQSIIGENHIDYRVCGAGDAVPEHTRVYGSSEQFGRKSRKQEGPGIAGGIDNASEAQTLHAFVSFADAKLARSRACQRGRELAELNAQDGRSKLVRAAPASPSERGGILHLKIFLAVPGIAGGMGRDTSVPQQPVIGNDGTVFPRADVGIDLEAENRNVAKGSNALIMDPSAGAPGAVFHQGNITRSSHRYKGHDIPGGVIHVRDQDCRGSRRDPAFDDFRVEAKSVVDIGKHWDGAEVNDRGGNRNPEVRRSNDRLARFYAKRTQRSIQGCRPAGHDDGVMYAHKRGKLAIELRGLPLRVDAVIPVQRLATADSKEGFFFFLIENMGVGKLTGSRRLRMGTVDTGLCICLSYRVVFILWNSYRNSADYLDMSAGATFRRPGTARYLTVCGCVESIE